MVRLTFSHIKEPLIAGRWCKVAKEMVCAVWPDGLTKMRVQKYYRVLSPVMMRLSLSILAKQLQVTGQEYRIIKGLLYVALRGYTLVQNEWTSYVQLSLVMTQPSSNGNVK